MQYDTDDDTARSETDSDERRERGLKQYRPTVDATEPKRVEFGETIEIHGTNLASCSVSLGPFGATVVEAADDVLVAEIPEQPRRTLSAVGVPDVPLIAGEGDTRSERRWRLEDVLDPRGRLPLVVLNDVGMFAVPDVGPPAPGGPGPAPAPEPETFVAPVNDRTVQAVGENQKYLVLITLPSEEAPYRDTAASAVTWVTSRVDAANDHLSEASFADLSFDFTVHDSVFYLDGTLDEYYRRPTPASIEGSGATYPVDLDGLQLDLTADPVAVTVDFTGTSLTLSDVVQQVNDAVLAASATPESARFEAFATDDDELRIETTTVGEDVTMTVSGSARGELGLVGVAASAGVDGVRAIREAVSEAAAKYADSQPGGLSALDDFVGVIVAHNIDPSVDPDSSVDRGPSRFRAHATRGPWVFTVTDRTTGEERTFNWGAVHITLDHYGDVYAHELGHNVGFPDLYDEPGPPESVGTELTEWDLMANSGSYHPAAWIKAWASGEENPEDASATFSPWVDHVEEIFRPRAGESIAPVEVLLTPSNVSYPPEEVFEGYTDLPVVQAVKLRSVHEGTDTDLDWHVYLEARESFEEYVSEYGEVSMNDRHIPGDGVIVTDALNRLQTEAGFDIPLERAHSTLLGGPFADVPADGSAVWSHTFPGGDVVEVYIQEVVEGDPRKPYWPDEPHAYKLRIEWGTVSGSGEVESDLSIRPWDAPPYESPDIWVDTAWENDWDEYVSADATENPDVPGHPVKNGDRLREGEPARLYARVTNNGPDAADNVRVGFSVVLPQGNQPGVPIGNDTITRIEPEESALASVVWTPTDANDGHACIQAAILDADGDPDPNVENNVAQENFTDWYLESGSPYSPVQFPMTVHNPLERQTECVLNVEGLREGYSVDLTPSSVRLDPDETATVQARIRADSSVPLDADLYRVGEAPPVVSISYHFEYGCTWYRVNGVSGVAHTVEKVEPEISIDDWDAGGTVTATVSLAPGSRVSSGGTPVTVRLTDDDGEVVAIARTELDGGSVTVELEPSIDEGAFEDLAMSGALRGDVFLSPTDRTGPGECRFTLDTEDEDRAA